MMTMNLPSVWGGAAAAPPGQGPAGGCSGHLFAYSGLSGTTTEQDPLVGIGLTTSDGLALLFCSLEHAPTLHIQGGANLTSLVRVATGDVLIAGGGISDHQLKLAWTSKDLLAGVAPLAFNVRLDYPTQAQATGVGCTRIIGGDSTKPVTLCVNRTRTDGRLGFGLAYEWSSSYAERRATAAAAMSISELDAIVRKHLAPYSALPATKEYGPLLAKALAVMRVNSLTPEGKIKRRWSTPDRLPHKWMWLWDSCYHSLAANHLNATLGWEYVAAVLDSAAPDGAIAIERTPTTSGGDVDQTQPPLLAWAVVENAKAARRAGVSNETVNERLSYALPRLAAYLRWDAAHRADPTGATALLRWTRGTESGMDNSPRFGGWPAQSNASELLAVDFSVFYAREAALLSTIAAELGDESEAAYWRAVSTNTSRAVHDRLFDANSGLYFDFNVARGKLSRVIASTALLPLWLDDLPKERLPRMLAALRDPSLFGTPVPLPSVARSMPSFSTDMWRGPMWVNSNYMTALALQARGAAAEADRLLHATLRPMQDAYMEHGVIFEFYDADGKADPRTLMRKGAPTGGVRDYHWSAALAFDMIMRLTKSAQM